MEKQLLAGTSMVEIAVVPGLKMDGYIARTNLSTGTHDPLTAAALVLEYGERRAALVTLDIMAVSKSFTDILRSDLASILRTSYDAILICASHTHAGPHGLQDWSPIEAAALDGRLAANVHDEIRQVVKQARDNLVPVRLRSALGTVSGIGGDRNRPERPVDEQVSVLVFEGMNDQPEAILFHFACHPTVLSSNNLEYSADFPGAARRRIREQYPNSVCLFVNGAAANISTRFFRRSQSFEEVDRLGGLLGDRIIELVAESSYNDSELKWACDSLLLPLRTFPSEARKVELSGNARIDTVRAEGITIESKLQVALQGRAFQQAEVCALQIGPWILLAVPGEAFNELARSLRKIFPKALVVGYVNDYLGYFPTQTSIDEATYEALSSAFDDNAHILLQDRLSELFRRMLFVG